MIFPFCFFKSSVIIYLLLHAYFCKWPTSLILHSLRKARFSMQEATSFLSFQGKDCEPPMKPSPLRPMLHSPYTCLVYYGFWLNIGWFSEVGVYQRLCMWCAYIGAQWDPMCLWVIVEKKRRDNDSEDWREGEKTTKGESISDSKIRSEAKGSTQCGDLWVKG